MLQKPVSNARAVQCINNATFLVDIVRIEPIFLIKSLVRLYRPRPRDQFQRRHYHSFQLLVLDDILAS